MDKMIKKGSINPYGGTIRCSLQGSKHAFSRILPSFLLFKKGMLTNVPNILDVKLQLDFIRTFGFKCSFDAEHNTLTYHGHYPLERNHAFSNDTFMLKHSRSLINLFPLVSRVNFDGGIPTGCAIGERDISWYLKVMSQFGIKSQRSGERLHLYREKIRMPDRIHIINRSFSSTNIAISCAVEQRLKLIIENPSIEPEILDLLDMIAAAGVQVLWDDECSLLHLDARDVDLDTEIRFEIMDDRNHAVTLIIGALLLGKKITLIARKPLQLRPFYELLEILNVKVRENDSFVDIDPANIKNQANLKFVTGPYPKVCSDWQPLIATLGKIGATIEFYEGLFESRLKYLDEYARFGIRYTKKDERTAIIFASQAAGTKGTIEARALDLRCGAGLGLLSTLAEDNIVIDNAVQIRRGYQDYPLDLNTLVGRNVYFYEQYPGADYRL